MTTTNNLTPTYGWKKILELLVLMDANAPASILDYYLDNIEGYSSMFCPLGYEPYKGIGHAMRNDTAIFDAAVQTGFACSAIKTLTDCALDGWENWISMKPGILHIMNNPQLTMYIDVHNRFILNALLGVETEEDWDEALEQIQKTLNTSDPKGY